MEISNERKVNAMNDVTVLTADQGFAGGLKLCSNARNSTPIKQLETKKVIAGIAGDVTVATQVITYLYMTLIASCAARMLSYSIFFPWRTVLTKMKVANCTFVYTSASVITMTLNKLPTVSSTHTSID